MGGIQQGGHLHPLAFAYGFEIPQIDAEALFQRRPDEAVRGLARQLLFGPGNVDLAALDAEGILGGLPLAGDEILWCCTELCAKEDMDKAAAIVRAVQGGGR